MNNKYNRTIQSKNGKLKFIFQWTGFVINVELETEIQSLGINKNTFFAYRIIPHWKKRNKYILYQLVAHILSVG